MNVDDVPEELLLPEGTPIPILDDKQKVIGSTLFVDNLTVEGAPDYYNWNGRVGLKRFHPLDDGGGVCLHDGDILFMYYDLDRPLERSYAEFITELEAYKFCLQRRKLDLIDELGLSEFISLEREVL